MGIHRKIYLIGKLLISGDHTHSRNLLLAASKSSYSQDYVTIGCDSR